MAWSLWKWMLSHNTKVTVPFYTANGKFQWRLGMMCFLITFLIVLYSSALCAPSEERAEGHFSPVTKTKTEKPILLIWFWPLNVKFSFEDCKTYFNIDGCFLTDNRSLYKDADAVLIYHKHINWYQNNLPRDPRPPFQKWIWYNVESPTNTHQHPNMDNLFNLSLTYRRDLSITARDELKIVTSQEKFVLPEKNKIVCWIASNGVSPGSNTRMNYYRELKKHVNVTVYGSLFKNFLKYEDYYTTLASCKFYLSFENSIHTEYITEKLNGPLVAGTVPIVLGTSRENYEQFIPSESFIHVNDFPNPKALADYLHELNQNNNMYMKYFAWRKHFKATPHLLSTQNEFKMAICVACDYIAKDNSFSVVHDLRWLWFNRG